ncbi:uncharacterized protein LOC119728100 [Patiria miniata]|uniref:Uncharacterized protein n=1 Tax=Patiria miniata TaxID=46514 RepID=A0A913ZYF7_PATMI|nr:uncharacterized protein LOC119728100 [Patiria miniata]
MKQCVFNLPVQPSVCATPTQADCRVRFLHTDHVTAAQTLSTGCSPTGGLLCRDADQAGFVRCLDYEVRFLCPSPIDALPAPHFHWDMSTKASIDADEPVTCGGALSSIYPNTGGMTGTVGGVLTATDSFDSSDHLCAVRNQKSGWVDYGSGNDKCIAEPACCTSGFTVTFWMKNRTPASLGYISIILSAGGQSSKARGMIFYLADYFSFDLRGVPSNAQVWKLNIDGYYPNDQWTHHSFTFEPAVGTNYYKNGTFVGSTNVTLNEGPGTSHFDNVVMFSRNNNPSTWPYPNIDGDFSNFKMFYKNFDDAEVQSAYLQETSESKLLIHYLMKHSHEDSFGVELECLAKAGSPPAIAWHRSDDGTYFESVSSSVDVAIYESLPNSYRRRSVLVVRHLTLASNVTFACEAVDTDTGGSVSKTITIPKRVMYWTPWLNADSTVDGDDRETLIQHQQALDLLCKYPSDIQCRTVYDGISSNETGQILNISCVLSSGLECLGADQGAEHDNSCFDYEVRYQCPEPLYRWTPWYDASDPDGTMEDETLATHMTQAYPDLCSQPIGAECRLKATQQHLIASGYIPEVPYLCNANGFRCQHADNTGSCPDFEVRYRCPDSTALKGISVDSLQQRSHHLDPDLTLTCSATVGHPTLGPLTLEWAWLDTSRPYAAVTIPSGGIVSNVSNSSPSVMTIENFTSSTYANTTLVCIARDGIFVDAKTIQITLPSFCELPLGVSSGKVNVIQITPSTINSSPFKVPGVNGLDPWVPAVSDATQTLDFDLGIDFAITGVAVQGDPDSTPPNNHLQSFGLRQRGNENDPWVSYTDGLGDSVFTTNYSDGSTSFTTLTPNVTTRFLRFQPGAWTGEIMVRVELYGCAVGASTLRILQLTKKYDVIANNVTFTCRAEHYPLPAITWLADGVPIVPLEGALEVSHTTDVFPRVASSLTVIDFHRDNDSVTFTCLARAGVEVEMANISTEYNFQGTVSVSSDPVVFYGSDVIVTCTASGDDIYVMDWGHRAASTSDPFVTVQSSGRFLIATVVDNATSWHSTLTISQFIQSDEAEYACLVNSDTARDTAVVLGRSGLWESWSNATYDETTNSYLLECAVGYPTIEPNVIWVVHNGDGAVQTNNKYQIQNRLVSSSGNLTKISTLTVHHYSYSQDDGAYQCSFTSAVQELNITVEAQYAYRGSITASTTKPIDGQSVHLICIAGDVVDRVYHADWLRVVGNDRIKIENDVTYSVSEDRSGGQFRLNLDINSYSRQEDGDYVCSINNGTEEATVFLSNSLGRWENKSKY